MAAQDSSPLNVLMVGTGEYTTGFVGGGASGSDKKVGVVGLTMFDLRRRGKVGNLSMVGTSGNKFPAIRMFYSCQTSRSLLTQSRRTSAEEYLKCLQQPRYLLRILPRQ
jgi:hypothetical protein